MTTKSLQAIGLFALLTLCLHCNSPSQREIVSFYNVPLTCGATPDLGCGSRIKPLFIATKKETSIKESWTNKQGTVIAIVWTDNTNEELMQSLFTGNDIETELISDSIVIGKVAADFRQEGKWLEGMAVDQLSIEEAGVIANNATQFAEEAGLITHEECEKIYNDFEGYFKKELVAVRTYDELKSFATQDKWMRDGYAFYEKHIGKQRADSVSALYAKHNEEHSEITCPKCGHRKTETMPTESCLLKYTCEKCKTDMVPKNGDCCVFCSYGTNTCPSKQHV